MNAREQFLETLLFGSPDRIPFTPGAPRESTLALWHAQGLPEAVPYEAAVQALVDAERSRRGLPAAAWPTAPELEAGVSFRMIPTFDEKVLEHRDGHYIVQDWMGAITEISDEYDYTYIRHPRDFVTRKWHRFPVQSEADWEAMKPRFDPGDPRRFPEDFKERCRRLRDRAHPLIIIFNGPFWQLREFCGMEGLCMMLLEQPGLVHEMARFWMEFVSAVLAPLLELASPDLIHVSEDMAFKEHPMISPGMTREFCAPGYRRWFGEAAAAGVPLRGIDSDGRVDLLTPVWLECGLNLVDPMEAAAGNDINAMRRDYGTRLAFRGGVDKRAIAAGGPVLEAELERVRPVIESGGYIPGCDHGVPPDISWANYQRYALRLAELTGWLR